MAVAFINAGTEGSGSGSTVTPGAPANPQYGDIWVCAVHTSNRSALSMPTGWTQAFQADGGGTTSRLAVFWHRYTGAAPTRTVTRAGATGAALIGGIASYRGCKHFGSPFHVVGSVTGGTDLSIEHAAITTAVAGCMLLAANGSADDNGRNAVTGWTPAFEDTASNTQRCYVLASGTPNGSVYLSHSLQANAGQATFGVNSVADPWTSVLMALQPSTATPLMARQSLNNSSVATPSVIYQGPVLFRADISDADMADSGKELHISVEMADDVQGEPDANLTWVSIGGGTWIGGYTPHPVRPAQPAISPWQAGMSGKRVRAVFSTPHAVTTGCFLET